MNGGHNLFPCRYAFLPQWPRKQIPNSKENVKIKILLVAIDAYGLRHSYY